MIPLNVFIFCVIAIVGITIGLIRKRLKNKSLEIRKEIAETLSGREQTVGDHVSDHQLFGDTCFDLGIDLKRTFRDQIISASQERDFTLHYSAVYKEACSCNRKLKLLFLTPSEIITRFIRDYEAIHEVILNHNARVKESLLETHSGFFDQCLKYPLDKQQRNAIISEEDNCLVVSSAGSGKTSSIIGKVKYLTAIKKIDPSRILLISYTNKAAAELTERLDTPGLRGYTFHKLAIDLIGQAKGIKPSICDKTDALFIKVYRDLLNDPLFCESIVEYFIDYESEETEEEWQMNERRQELSEQKKKEYKALLPDMDGRVVRVKSSEEQKICFALSSLGVKFRYEEQYEYNLADDTHSQYQPDFSIYFEKDGVRKRIYLEHYGIDEHGNVPAWFAKDQNMTYEEANQKYRDSINWKRAAHERFGTKLITTTSADFHYTEIRNKLRNLLTSAGVPLHEKTEEELYDLVLPKSSKQEKVFIRLVITFVTLLKSSYKSIDDVLKQAEWNKDKRSSFVIDNIFRPVCEGYLKALRELNQIDFTDAILQATEICRTSHAVSYDYIIVDEFQDISVDRYLFLKVLREGNPPAKLFCVGDDWQSIYRFSGSDMALFNQFSAYFGTTEINKIETTYRFGEPLVGFSSQFIQRNKAQLQKNIRSFDPATRTEMSFYAYTKSDYATIIDHIMTEIPAGKSVFLLGRYSFDDYYLANRYQSVKRGSQFFYKIAGREVEFLTVHKSKGLEADYIILLQCNKDTYGFPSLISDDPVLNYVLTQSDEFPHGEERRLFYVAMTRAKIKTIILYDKQYPSVFVNEFLYPEKIKENGYVANRNANKRWTRAADKYLVDLHNQGKSIKYISEKMGRSQTSVLMRLEKLNS